MTDTPATPIIYVKPGCPHCLKLRLFLLEAGLLPGVRLVGEAPGELEAARESLAGSLDTVTFPAARFAPDDVMAESDAIIARFAGEAGIDPAALPTLQAYVTGPLRRLGELRQELKALQSRAG